MAAKQHGDMACCINMARNFWSANQIAIYGTPGGYFFGSLLRSLWDLLGGHFWGHFGDHFGDTFLYISASEEHRDILWYGSKMTQNWNVKVISKGVQIWLKIMTYETYHRISASKISCHVFKYFWIRSVKNKSPSTFVFWNEKSLNGSDWLKSSVF